MSSNELFYNLQIAIARTNTYNDRTNTAVKASDMTWANPAWHSVAADRPLLSHSILYLNDPNTQIHSRNKILLSWCNIEIPM